MSNSEPFNWPVFAQYYKLALRWEALAVACTEVGKHNPDHYKKAAYWWTKAKYPQCAKACLEYAERPKILIL